ncbi:polyphosphate kinase 2 [Chthonobacter rhizosphaerae]|uniref:polyphosphate kinase 2 n=1 Tax=Chthonobacter rhizosphaerae TaxID=2735553 RepID=UPI0015EF0B31|nr:polyphosphate kinase 2 [Chthonobacter rhizosphaerae]
MAKTKKADSGRKAEGARKVEGVRKTGGRRKTADGRTADGGAAARNGADADAALGADRPEAVAAREGAAVLAAQAPEAPAILVGGIAFDLDDPHLPPEIRDGALASGGYPYEDTTKDRVYEDQLRLLQIELVKLQQWVVETGERVMILFEGRDAAGKGGMVSTFRAYMNPRSARSVALPKPSDTERGQWYFQRYVAHLPTRGEIVLFDRSWYNRAGVERVMGFCTEEESDTFLAEAPKLEALLVEDGLRLFKVWLDIGREMQLKRFHDRRHDPLKIWKLSPVDIKALALWDDYTAARDRMLAATHTDLAPWLVIKANDKKRARLNAIRHVLTHLDYEGKSADAIGAVDPAILGHGPDILKSGG